MCITGFGKNKKVNTVAPQTSDTITVTPPLDTVKQANSVPIVPPPQKRRKSLATVLTGDIATTQKASQDVILGG